MCEVPLSTAWATPFQNPSNQRCYPFTSKFPVSASKPTTIEGTLMETSLGMCGLRLQGDRIILSYFWYRFAFLIDSLSQLWEIKTWP
jgi:hypothetical protein